LGAVASEPDAGASAAGLRVADEDRERAAGELREHMLAGRLSQQEFEERVTRVTGSGLPGLQSPQQGTSKAPTTTTRP